VGVSHETSAIISTGKERAGGFLAFPLEVMSVMCNRKCTKMMSIVVVPDVRIRSFAIIISTTTTHVHIRSRAEVRLLSHVNGILQPWNTRAPEMEMAMTSFSGGIPMWMPGSDESRFDGNGCSFEMWKDQALRFLVIFHLDSLLNQTRNASS
jgi:hypothetical protein